MELTNQKLKGIPANIKILMFFYIFSFSLDYRNAPGASLSQILFLTIYIISAFLLIVLLFSRSNTPLKSMHLYFISFLWWFYLFVTFLSALIFRVALTDYFKIALPLYMIGITLIIFIGLIHNRYHFIEIIHLLFWAAFISFIPHLINSLTSFSNNIIGVRHRITSMAMPFVISYTSIQLIFNYNNLKLLKKFFYIFILLFSIVLIFYSLTRGYLLNLVFILIGIVIINKYCQTKFSFISVQTLLKFSGIFLITVFIILQFPLVGDFFIQWARRLFEENVKHGLPLTAVIRVAQIEGQWESLFESFNSLLFGKGFGSIFYYGLDAYKVVPNQFFQLFYTPSAQFPDDQTWTHYFYYNGIIFGSILLYIYLKSLFNSFVAIKQIQETLRYNKSEIITIISFISLLAYLSNSLFSNIFSHRFISIILGFIIAISNYQYDYFKSSLRNAR